MPVVAAFAVPHPPLIVPGVGRGRERDIAATVVAYEEVARRIGERAPETIVTAVLFSMIGYFNGNQKTVWVMVQGLVQTLLVRLPMAYLMSIQPNASLTKIGLAAPVSTAVGILLNVGFYLYLNHREKDRGSRPLTGAAGRA